MRFTPLHRELGVGPEPITFGLVRDAIAAEVEERHDLEWKASLPDSGGLDEFAKDVGALANSGGGLLVYGVTEKGGGSSAATAVQPSLVWNDAEQRRLQAVAWSSIQPPVPGLRFTPVVEVDSGNVVVFLEVPASADAPHLVSRRGSPAFTAPVRYGAQTTFLSERQLDAAYRDRRAAREQVDAELVDLAEDAMAQVRDVSSVWMTVSAVPHRPRPLHLGRVSNQEFRAVVEASRESNPVKALMGRTFGWIHPRPGLRRWYDRDEGLDVPTSIVSIRDSGATVWALSIDAVRDLPRAHLDPHDLQEGIAHGLWLASKASEMLNVFGEFSVRVQIHQAPDPFYIRLFEHREILVEPAEPVHRFSSVADVLDPSTEPELIRAARGLATDVFNQGGHTDIGDRYLVPDPESCGELPA